MRYWFWVVVWGLMAPALLPAQNVHPDYADGKIFVKIFNQSPAAIPEWQAGDDLQPLNSVPKIKDFVSQFGIKAIEKPFLTPDENLQHIYEFRFAKSRDVETLIEGLQALPYIEYAEKIPLMRSLYNPDDVSFLQWHLTTIEAPQAWDFSKGREEVVVAIVDDAVRLTHEDLAPQIYTNPGEIPGNGIDDDGNGFIDDVNGWDAADGDNDPSPPAGATNSTFSHGTHVAGISAAATDNGTGIASIGFNVKILPCKSKLDSTIGTSFLDNTYRALDYAIIMGADVANMSFGGQSSLTFRSLCDAAYWQGVVLVAAAGNDGQQTTIFPAGYDHVISVGSTTLDDSKSGFSNYHQTIDVMAPGSQIYSTNAGSDDAYGFKSGTSMASPVVAGIVGLMISVDSTLTPDQVEACLEAGCDNIDAQNSSYVGFIGAGRVNAFRTLDCLINPVGVAEPAATLVQGVFPNPTQGLVHVNLYAEHSQNIRISLVDMQGRALKTLTSRQVSEGNQSIELHIPDGIANGLYLLRVEGEAGASFEKVQLFR